MKIGITLYFTGRAAPLTAEIDWHTNRLPTPIDVEQFVQAEGSLFDPAWGNFSWDSNQVEFFSVREIEK